jgi:predicted RNase H-like HicB family nuclease
MSCLFRIILKPEHEGGYTVTVPSLSGCITYGDTLEEAVKMGEEAISCYLESMKKHGEEIIDDSGTLEMFLTIEYV